MDSISFNSYKNRLAKSVVIESEMFYKQNILAATSLRSQGNMSLIRNFDGSAETNNEKLFNTLNIDLNKSTIFFPYLIHSSNVALVGPKSYGRITLDQKSPEILKLAVFESKFNSTEQSGNEDIGLDSCICSIDANSYIGILPADCAQLCCMIQE